jgi:AcrR family transcriptional regulator
MMGGPEAEDFFTTRIADQLSWSPHGYPRCMVSAEVGLPGVVPGSPAKSRIVSAATALFAEHGVGGTSLQMIADTIGVTKAAVYHQFKAKDEIVIAVAEAELARLEAVLDAAQAEPDPARAREVLLSRIVDLAIERRHMESTLASDPVLNRFFAGHEPFRQVMKRLYRMLLGEDSPEARLSGAMLTAAIGGAVMHPMAEGLDDEALRSQLLRLARRFLDLPG